MKTTRTTTGRMEQMAKTIFEAFADRGGVAGPGKGAAVWGGIKGTDGHPDEAAEDAAAAEAGYVRQSGPDGDYFVPVRG